MRRDRSRRNRARVRAAPAQRGDVVIPVDPLETRYDYDVAFGKLVVKRETTWWWWFPHRETPPMT